MAKLYTECIWEIELDNKQNARHDLSFKVFNLTERFPSIQKRIELFLPRNTSFESWDTQVEGRSLGPGYGYDKEENIYRLNFSDIENISHDPEINAKVSFTQKQAVSKIGNINIFNLNFRSEFHSSSIEVSVSPPKVVANWRKYISNVLSMLIKKRLVVNYDIQPFGHSPRIDFNIGKVIYQHRKMLPGSGIIYKSISSIELKSFIVGGIFIIVFERGLDFLLRYLWSNYSTSNASLQ